MLQSSSCGSPWQAIETRDIDAIMSRYPERVVYRDYGIVNRAFIREDFEKYFVRWPNTQAKLIKHFLAPTRPRFA
jgi:hypothetical protein